MNRTLFAKALILVTALAITLTPGCRRKPKEPITPLGSGRTGPGTIQNPQPGRLGDTSGGLDDRSGALGSNLGGGPTAPVDTNIAQTGGPVNRWEYTEDRSQFAANTVLFDFDSAVIKSSEKALVASVAAHLVSNPNTAVEIEGHCDERGTEEYHRSLGERRALAIREELASLGIDPKRVHTISYGEDRPAVDGHNESAWARNRRGEFVLLLPR
ncbi:MAG: OmpA family protein [Limisphaerales bacterium]